MSTTGTPDGTATSAAERPHPLPLHRGDRRGGRSASPSASSRPSSPWSSSRSAPAFVALIKMMIQPVIFCTIVLGVGSVRSAARVGKVGGLALGYFLDHVDGRARHRPGRRQHPAPGHGPADLTDALPGAGAGAGRRGPRQHDRVPARHHPRLDVLRADRGRGAADPAGGAARRLRAAGDGPLRRADPARRRAPAAAGLPGPRR